MDGRIVIAPVEAELRRISLKSGILDIEVRHADLSISPLKSIEPAVGVLLQQIEEGRVVLKSVRTQVAKDPHAVIFIGEDEAPKIRGELLNPGADRDEIIVRAQVFQLHFDKGFLQANVFVKPVRPFRHVCVDDAIFLGGKIVQIEGRSKPHLPIDRSKRRVALKQVEAEAKHLRQKELAAVAEERRGIRLGRALIRGCRQPAPIHRRRAASGKVEKRSRPQNIGQHRVIALVLVPVERVIPMAKHIGRAQIVGIPPVIRHRSIPPVRLRQIDHVIGRKAKHRRHDRAVIDTVPAQFPVIANR